MEGYCTEVERGTEETAGEGKIRWRERIEEVWVWEERGGEREVVRAVAVGWGKGETMSPKKGGGRLWRKLCNEHSEIFWGDEEVRVHTSIENLEECRCVRFATMLPRTRRLLALESWVPGASSVSSPTLWLIAPCRASFVCEPSSFYNNYKLTHVYEQAQQ